MRARVGISIALLVAALVFVQFRSHGEAVPPRKPLETFQATIAGWHPRESSLFTDDIQNILKASDYVMRRYSDDAGRSLWLFIGYWDTQRKGAQPHSPQNCLPGNGWDLIEVSRESIPLTGGAMTVNRVLIQKEQQRQLVYYWYRAQGSSVASEIDAKLQMMKNAILRNRTDGAIVRVTSPVYGSVAATSAQLTAFVQALEPVLSEYLPD
jgi:EpsI family protein